MLGTKAGQRWIEIGSIAASITRDQLNSNAIRRLYSAHKKALMHSIKALPCSGGRIANLASQGLADLVGRAEQ